MVLIKLTKAQKLFNYDGRKTRRKSLKRNFKYQICRTRKNSFSFIRKFHGEAAGGGGGGGEESFESCEISNFSLRRSNKNIVEKRRAAEEGREEGKEINEIESPSMTQSNDWHFYYDNHAEESAAAAATRAATTTTTVVTIATLNCKRTTKSAATLRETPKSNNGSYLCSKSLPILRLCFTRKRRLKKRRKRKYFLHKRFLPPTIAAHSNASTSTSTSSPESRPESSSKATTRHSTLFASLQSTSTAGKVKSLAQLKFVSAIEKIQFNKNYKITTTTTTTNSATYTQKERISKIANFSNKITNHHKSSTCNVVNNKNNNCNTTTTTTTTTGTTTSVKRKFSMKLHSLFAYYAATIFRLFLTTLTSLATSTTSTILSTTSACLAASAKTVLAAATTLPTLMRHRWLRCCSTGNACTKSNHNSIRCRRTGSKCFNYRDSNRYCRSGLFNLVNKHSWIFLLIYLNLYAKVCLAGYHEKRLLHDLLDPYNTLERPVLNESDPLQLSFGLTLMQIIDVDEKNQLLVTNVWLKLEWNDMNLRWNTSDYGGVKDLRIPPHRIWKPDVLMYNSADEGFDGTYQTNVVVRNNGSCLYVPPGIFKSTCKIDITWFPFDDQRCEMKFGSWTYDGFQLDLQLQDETGGDISSYVLNGEWELLGVPGKRNEIYYNCCPEPYIDITFTIIIRRRTLYYFFNLIIPCVLIASMALLGFTLPPDSGEKLSLGVTILLSLTVFLNMVAETMPATSDAVPLLGTYFNCIMFMVASSVVSTILILNYHHRNADTHEMSEWIRIVFLCWLPWLLRMSRPGRPLILEFPATPCSDTSSERKHQILSDVELKERSSKSLLANVLDIDDDFRHSCRPMTPGGGTLPQNPPFYRTVYGQGDDGSIGPIGGARMPDAVSHHTCIKTATEYELGLILKEIRFITDQLRKEDEDNDIANDWKFAAMVVDRLCLIIFTMFTILATIAVLLSAPHIIVS